MRVRARAAPRTWRDPRAREDVLDEAGEPRAPGHVVLLALEGVLRHGPRARDLLRAPVEVREVRLEHLVPLRRFPVEQRGDLPEPEARGLRPQDHGDADDVVVGEPPSARTVALRREQTDVLPVPQDVGRETEALGDLPGRASRRRTWPDDGRWP